jgi:alanine racemase
VHPTILLDTAILKANAIAWAQHAGVPVRAVVKADAYGWGVAAVVRSLEQAVDGFVVGDLDEFVRVRALTTRQVTILGDVPQDELERVLGAGGLANVSSPAALATAAAWARRSTRRARVRVGVRNAAGWAGLAPDDAIALAPALAAAPLDVELWAHITDPAAASEQRTAFAKVHDAFVAAGVRVVGTDLESTMPLAAGGASGGSVRVGIGLFGFRYVNGPQDVRCALTVRAPIVQEFAAQGQRAGYGGARAPAEGRIAVLRLGYADGFPRGAWPELGILAVGMQYTIVTSPGGWTTPTVKLLGSDSDLDAFALGAGIGPHELVIRLGHGRSERAHPGAGAR